jgi:hypothetical protein
MSFQTFIHQPHSLDAITSSPSGIKQKDREKSFIGFFANNPANPQMLNESPMAGIHGTINRPGRMSNPNQVCPTHLNFI